MDKSKYILVTGGAGFIGSHTVVALLNQGFRPLIVDDFRNSNPDVLKRIEQITGSLVEMVNADVCDRAALSKVFENYPIDTVIHFAADKAVGESVANPLKYFDNNIGGLISLLDVMKKYAVKKLVFSSSCTVYGIPNHIPVDESEVTKTPESPYGFTKLINEQMLLQYSDADSDFGVVLLRYFNPIGAHDSGLIGEEPQGIPNNLLPYITQAAVGKRAYLTVYGDDYDTFDGTCVRDYIHVMDLAEAHVAALEFLSQQPQAREVFNLGTGNGTSVMQMIHYFEEISQQQLNFKIGARRPGDVPSIYAKADKASKILNWRCKRSVKQAIADAWNYEQLQLKQNA
jgi:UDP-glucose 4-epimerase